MKGRSCFELFAAAVIGLALSLSAWGQATTSLNGTVTDPSGATVPQAKVTITNEATSLSRQTATRSSGEYDFASVLPGRYTLTVEAQGFSTYVQKGIPLQVNLPSTVNVRLQVGALSAKVEVTARPPQLNTTDASLGKTMGGLAIQDLPLDAENMPLLLSLQAGVVFNGEKILTDDYDTRAGAVNGERSDQNNITLDGVTVNDEFSGYAFYGVLPATQFSVEEFRVTTSNYGATEGRSAGAQIAMVTKGGTNQHHGALYEFNRSTIGEANDYFLKMSELQSGQPNVPQHLVRNIFGGTLGGPILKDRLFFFFNYEGHRESQAISEVQTIPSATLRDGIIQYGCADATQCPGGGVTGMSGASYPVQAGYYALGPTQLKQMDPLGIGPSQVALSYFQTYPLPNDYTVGNIVNFAGYRFGAATTQSNDWLIGRLDYNLAKSGNHSLFLRGAGRDDGSNGPPFLPGRRPQYKSVDLSKGFVAGYTGAFGGHFVNNLRYGLTHQSIATPGDTDLPWVDVRDLSQDINYSSGFTAPVHNLVDTATWQKGSHSLQFGANTIFVRRNDFSTTHSFSDALTNSDWLFSSGFANKNDPLDPAYGCTHSGPCFPAVSTDFNHAYDFPLAGMMGVASEVDAQYNYHVDNTKSASPLAQGAPVIRHWATDTYDLFFQDTWRVRPHLSVTYGLNYQLMTPITETAGQEVAPSVNMGDWFNQRRADMLKGTPSNQDAVIAFEPAGSIYGRSGLYGKQTSNFAPRVGVAWSPHAQGGWLGRLLGGDKTVVRAGFGMYYDNFGPALALRYDANGSFGLSTTLTNPAGALTPGTAPRITSMNEIPTSIMVPAPASTFPVTYPNVEAIAAGVDQSLKTPYSYAVDFSIQRQLPGDMTLDLAYVGHMARRLMALDDIAAPLNLVDPKSGIDYFTAAKRLSQMWRANTSESSISDSTVGKTAQYWQDMLAPQSSYSLCSTGGTTTSFLQAVYDVFGPGCGNLYNETSALYYLDVAGYPTAPVDGYNTFYNSQYSSLWTWSSLGYSNYNAFQLGLHKQMSQGMLFGFNYTYSKSNDIESESERGHHYLTDSVINAWSISQMYGPSDFDLRHQINGYWVAQLPFGHGKPLGRNVNKLADAVIGGWQLGGTARWTSGFPVSVFMGYVWPTNWDEMGWADLTGKPIQTGHTTAGVPNIFTNPSQASLGFDYAYPGESGVRNPIRGDGYFGVDMNLAKTFSIRERHNLQFRWSVFNVTNSARFDAYSMQAEWDVPNTFGNYSQTLTQPRVMEFSLIYQF
jgi:hypothetical protein